MQQRVHHELEIRNEFGRLMEGKVKFRNYSWNGWRDYNSL